MRTLGPERVAGRITFHDQEPAAESLRDAALRGLGSTPRTLPCKFLYDERGAQLFEEICRLEEYYPTRTETAILRRHAREIARRAGAECRLVELGSGSSTKTRILLDRLDAPSAYVPVDISRAQLLESAAQLATHYPSLRVMPVCADYTEPLKLPVERGAATLAFFPGSTIGNFEPEDAVAFLRGVGEACGDGSGLLIGVDLRKDSETLERAYDDSAGVTAAFNLNLLERLRRECGAEVDPAGFRHRAVYDARRGRIEMHLVSMGSQSIRIPTGRDRAEFHFSAGESIVTEHSYKYDPASFAALARRAGYALRQSWTDERSLFSVHHLVFGG